MDSQKLGVVARLKVRTHAKVAALRHRRPSRSVKVILVAGLDGSDGTVAFLASILRASGERVGVITQQYVEIGDERAKGSDQADVHGDPYRLQGLLAHMRRAACTYAILEVPSELPPHQFMGIHPEMVVIRRCGDNYTDQTNVAARVAMLHSVLGRKPTFVVYNRDDPAASEFTYLSGREGVISFGTHHKAECKIARVEVHPKGSALQLVVDHQTDIEVVSGMTGKQAVYNIAAATAAAYVLHVPIEAIEQGVRAQPQLPNQLEFVPLQRPYELILDASVTPGGLAESLEVCKHFVKNRLIVLFGAPLAARASQLQLFGEVVAAFADRVVITDGEYADSQSPAEVRERIVQGISAAGGEAKTDEVTDRQAAIEKAVSIARRGDLVVIAGVTQRPYRQLGTERLPWSDRKVIDELFEP